MKLRVLVTSLAICGVLAACGKDDGAGAAQRGKQVHVYNWSDYIAPETNPEFEQKTGIKVIYDVFDSNEVLEAKLLAGSTGYDVVVPSLSFLGRQIQAGVFLPLDKSRLSNYKLLDPELMQRLESQDPGNQYAVPYMWGTTGIGYNVDKVKAAFGDTDIANSLDIIFKPENVAKMKDCGVMLLDTAAEVLPMALKYIGEDPNSFDPKVIEKGAAVLKAIRPYVGNFHSSQYIDALANGDACLVIGWSGDIIQARDRAVEAGNGVNVAYAIPREGAPMWFDMLAIPKDAKYVDEAYAYIDNLLDPQVMAKNSNFISFPNAIPASKALMDQDVLDDPTIYPPPEVEAKLFTLTIVPPEVDRVYTRLWTELKTGK